MDTPDRLTSFDSFKAHVTDAERRDAGWAEAQRAWQEIAELKRALMRLDPDGAKLAALSENSLNGVVRDADVTERKMK